MIHPELLADVEARIRDYVIGLPRDEKIDTVMLATVLLHYMPRREVNLWMVFVAPQGSAKTRLLSLLADHPAIWTLPDKLSAGYFLNSRALYKSALFRFDESKARLFYLADMSTLTDGIPFQYAGDLDAQIRNIHDGRYEHESGLNSVPLRWGPKAPNETPGFIGAATESFYDYLKRAHLLGSRFMCYYMDPAHYRDWTDTHDLEQILLKHAELGPQRDAARHAVHTYLETMIPLLDRVHDVEVPSEVLGQMAAASTFVGRILGAGKLQDRGERRAVRIETLIRLFAFMRGRDVVGRDDVHLGLRIVFSQLPPEFHRLVAFALSRRDGWKLPELLTIIGSTRAMYAPRVQALVDLGILEETGRKGHHGYKYLVTRKASRLIEKFDREALLYRGFANAPDPAAELSTSVVPSGEW